MGSALWTPVLIGVRIEGPWYGPQTKLAPAQPRVLTGSQGLKNTPSKWGLDSPQ